MPTRLIGSILLVLLSTGVGAVAGIVLGGQPAAARQQESVQQEQTANDQQATTIQQLQTAIEQENATIQQLQAQIATLNATDARLELSRPTYDELEAFLAANARNRKSPNDPSYVCLNFAHDLKAAAASAGWNMSFVVANIAIQVAAKSSQTGQSAGGIVIFQTVNFAHAFNSVILQDGRTVYVEPQNDKIFLDEKSLIEAMVEEFFPSSQYLVANMTIEDTVLIY
jgi:TolA-binding protein